MLISVVVAGWLRDQAKAKVELKLPEELFNCPEALTTLDGANSLS